MLRILLPTVTAVLLATLIAVSSRSAEAAAPDFAEVCYQATLEPPELKITDRIIGYCTSAITGASTAAESEAARANLLNNRAILHLKMKNRAAARADLDEALRIHPGSMAARVTLSHLHWLEGNLVAADEILAQGVQGDVPPQLLINRSIVRRTRGDTAGAVRDAMQLAGYDAETIDRLTPEVAPAPPPSGAAETPGTDAIDQPMPQADLAVPEVIDPEETLPEDEDINRD